MIRRTFLKGAAAVSFSLMVSPALTAFAKDSVRVYVGGPIFTMNKNNDIAEAIAVKGETILAVGKKAEVMAAAGSGATVVDLKGKALIPGMIDGHSHFPSGAFNELTMVNLNVPPLGRAESIADMQSLLKERAAQTKKGEWIVGYNYNDLAIKEQRHPTRADLDAVSTEHPIFAKACVRPFRLWEMPNAFGRSAPCFPSIWGSMLKGIIRIGHRCTGVARPIRSPARFVGHMPCALRFLNKPQPR